MDVFNILWCFLPGILALGIITSYEDIKFGKIRNKWIILALIYAFIVYFVLITYYYFTVGINVTYLIELLTNILFIVAAGFGLWYLRVWTAGDGKLFIAYATLIPLSTYAYGYQKWIPSFTLLINIFTPALMIMVGLMLFKIKMSNVKNVLKSSLKEFFQPKKLIKSAVSLFAIYWAVQMLLSLVRLEKNFILSLVLTIVVFSIIEKKLGSKALYFMLGVSLLRLVLDKSIYSLTFLVNFLVLIFVWRFIRGFLSEGLSKLGQELFSKEVSVNELKPGMILSERIEKKEKNELRDLKKEKDTEIIKYEDDYYIKQPKSLIQMSNFIGEEAEGLTEEQINKIKKIGIKKIKVSQTIPFAPFMFLGVLLTIIANGNILIVVKSLV